MKSVSIEMTFWDEEFLERLQALKTQMTVVEKAQGLRKSQELQVCQQKLSEISSNVRRPYGMELRKQPAEIKYSFQLKLETYDKELEDMKSRITLQEREVLLGTKPTGSEFQLQDSLMDTNTGRTIMLSETNKVQNKTEESLKRSLQNAREMNEIGAEALQKMEAQTEQLGKVQAKVDQMESELKKAQQLLKGILKRMMTDKLILLFVGLIFLAIVGLVIYIAVSPQDSDPNAIEDLIPNINPS